MAPIEPELGLRRSQADAAEPPRVPEGGRADGAAPGGPEQAARTMGAPGGTDAAAPEQSLLLAGFADESIVDGPGLRLTVFCQGCPHHCPGCQNPETWPFEGGMPVPVDEVAARAARDPLVRGVTLSGGEPFAQAEGCAALAALLKARGYEVAAYTGYTFGQLLEGTDAQKALLGQLDILVDGPFVQAECSLELRFRGSRNQRILDVPKSLAAGGPVWSTDPRWVGGE